MKILAVRLDPPPIHKITVDLMPSEAYEIAEAIKAAWNYRAGDGWNDYDASDSGAVMLAKRIEELLK